MNSVTVKVAEQIAGLSPKVEGAVVDVLVTRELTRRSEALVTVMDKLTKAEKDFKKLGPDTVTFDENGQKLTETFSKARTEERKKATEQIEKMTKAINKALENADFDNVYNFANQKSGSSESE